MTQIEQTTPRNTFSFLEEAQPKRAVVFWSPDHAADSLGMPCDTYLQLCQAQRAKGSVCSTTLMADDEGIKNIVTVFEAESNGTLKYHDVVPTTLRVVGYRMADYATFDEAMQDGAVYDTGIVLAFGDQEGNAVRYQAALAAMEATSKMINNDQSLSTFALIDDQGEHMTKHWHAVDLKDRGLTHFFTDAFIEKTLLGYDEDIPR